MDAIIPSHAILFVDAGNTTLKGAVWDGDGWTISPSFQYSEPEVFANWLSDAEIRISKVVSCSVSHQSSSFLEDALPRSEVLSLTYRDLPTFLLDYHTPDTLGMDRFFACYGAFNAVNQSVVVIDAGTAITIDMMDAGGRFLGGVIMPGVAGLKDVFKEQAPALPGVDLELPATWPGKSTLTSLQWGKTGLLKDGIEGVLSRFSEPGEAFELFITGGDAAFVQALINRGTRSNTLIFAGMKAFITRYPAQG